MNLLILYAALTIALSFLCSILEAVLLSVNSTFLKIKIKEGNKERLQSFQGTVIQRRGSGTTETFTIRKMSGGTGVERIFPLASPSLEKIIVNKEGAVRRSRLFYLRERKNDHK